MMDTRLHCLLDARAGLGECPVWLPRERRLGWIDIHAGRLHRLDPATGEDTFVELGEAIGSFAPRAAGGFVAGLRSGFWTLDAEGHKDRALHDPNGGHAALRLNDGRCDRQGRFWAGGIDEAVQGTPRAGLHRMDPGGACSTWKTGLTVSNGLAFSPDGRLMYHTDTPTRVVWVHDYDPDTGTPSNPRVFHRFEGRFEFPDGATVDAEGGYWVALWGAARVVRIAPEGGISHELEVPARQPTMPAFGGPDLRTLFVTSARQELPEHELQARPLSGGVFVADVGVAGLPEPAWAG